MKPICLKCQKFFKCTKNGVYFVEGMPVQAAAGVVIWKPYKLWAGDTWKCPGCGAEIISGVGARAIGEHFEPRFEDMLKRLNPLIQIDDC